MATINILVPPLKSHVYTGGIWCVFEYAHGLYSLGHHVNIIPILPCETPEWFTRPYGSFVMPTLSQRLYSSCSEIKSTVVEFWSYLKNRDNRERLGTTIQSATESLLGLTPKIFGYSITRALSFRHARQWIPEADITIATSFETVLPTFLFGTGKKFYFMQHYEVLFHSEKQDPEIAKAEAQLSYHLGLQLIANSSWLQNTVMHQTGVKSIPVCLNAIDHTIFNSMDHNRHDTDELIIISYGGRNAAWKGFADMADAVRISRLAMPETNLRWQVYGNAILPPDNKVAKFEPLGFLQPSALAQAYRNADIMLSASWYESFPLFPLEAMACGLATISTALGTEDYAIHGVNAEIVIPREPQSIADAIIKLAQNTDYRKALGEHAKTSSRNFTWEKSVNTMEAILLEKDHDTKQPH